MYGYYACIIDENIIMYLIEIESNFDDNTQSLNAKFYTDKYTLKQIINLTLNLMTYHNDVHHEQFAYYLTFDRALSVISYKFIKKDGHYITYYDNGQICEEFIALNGKINGKLYSYEWNGRLLRELSYIDGELYGIQKFYDYESGEIKKIYNFKNNCIYDDDGDFYGENGYYEELSILNYI